MAFFGTLHAILLLSVPFLFSGWNIAAFVYYLVKKKEKPFFKGLEIAALCTGFLYLFMYIELASDITFAAWDEQLVNSQRHSFVAPDALPTVAVIAAVGVLGYLFLRFVPAAKQPPLLCTVGIAAVYLGIGLCVLLCVQTSEDLFLFLLPANCILLFVKSICMVVLQKNALLQSGASPTKYAKLSALLNKASHLPWVALLLALPLLGVLILILLLFGQAPNSIITAWTQTADWALSQKIPPPNAQYDEHYLCTVAASGHKKVVKPLRPGLRHGHHVVVNRQLCVANAFEELLAEKLPRFHRLVRKVYDNTGYPLSRHIRSKTAADAVYIIMKPLEWLFTAVLYAVDVHPENRIAVQYPHAALPHFLCMTKPIQKL